MKEEKLTLKMMRELLSIVDISDIEEKELTEVERKDYCAAIFAVFPRLEKDIKRAAFQQLKLTFESADNMDKVALGQGTVNGMSVLLELWKKANIEYQAQPKEDFDKNNPLSEI